MKVEVDADMVEEKLEEEEAAEAEEEEEDEEEEDNSSDKIQQPSPGRWGKTIKNRIAKKKHLRKNHKNTRIKKHVFS